MWLTCCCAGHRGPECAAHRQLPLTGTIVDQLAARARAHGAEMMRSAPVAAVLHDGLRVLGVRLDDGTDVRAAYPNPRVIAAFGVDRPLYFAVHSASADLAPAGGAVIHAAKYLNPDVQTDPREDERELEELMDLLQPGWRDHVKVRRYLPRMTVAHAIPTAAGGGFRSRPAIDALGLGGLLLAGDWGGCRWRS